MTRSSISNRYKIRKREGLINAEIYQFKLGPCMCTAVCDGIHVYSPPAFPSPAAFLFTHAPKEEIELAFQKHVFRYEERATWVSSFNCLFIDTGEYRVLIDTGAGDFGPETGKLLRNLVASGASPASIDHVILTHAHPDHIGGCTDNNGVPTFPRAKYLISKTEWDFWRS